MGKYFFVLLWIILRKRIALYQAICQLKKYPVFMDLIEFQFIHRNKLESEIDTFDAKTLATMNLNMDTLI